METNRLPGSDRAELLASHESSGPNQHMAEAQISETERSGSITALGVLLGFSIAILSEWSNRPGQWEPVGAIPLFLYGISVALQVVALYRALQVPREIQADHRRTINLAVIGLVVMFVGFLSTIVIDVLGEAPVSTPTAISRRASCIVVERWALRAGGGRGRRCRHRPPGRAAQGRTPASTTVQLRKSPITASFRDLRRDLSA